MLHLLIFIVNSTNKLIIRSTINIIGRKNVIERSVILHDYLITFP